MSLIELRRVHFAYPEHVSGLAAPRRAALQEVNLSIAAGTRLALLGVNGAGKSTLLMLLNGSLRPSAGEVRFDGAAVDYSRRGLSQLRQAVALVLQDPDDQLFAGTVRQDVSFGPFNLGLDEASVRTRVDAVLEAFGLSDLADLPPHQLSHGQKKRVALAGALAMQPRALVLDEPTAGLDPNGVEATLDQLTRLHQRGITIVIATHDLDFAQRWASGIALMDQGRVVASGGVDLLFDADAMSRIGLRARPCFARDGVSAGTPAHRKDAPSRNDASLIPTVTHGGAQALEAPKGVDLVDASASINPLGFPAWLRPEISRSLALVQHYPDPNCRELVAAIALADGASADQVVVGNGSSELLSWLPHAAQHPRWVVAVPSFGEYRRAPALAGKELLDVPLTDAPNFGVDWARLAAALSGPSVVVLGHPNNPTGKLLRPNEFHAFRERHPECLFVVDEAFGDFVTEFVSVWDRAASNLVVLRSLTKILAIPGLRLGYALTSPALARGLRRYLPPWSVNVLAQRVGIRFFSDPALVIATRQHTERLKTELVAALSGIAGLEIHASCANWLLLRLPEAGLGSSDVVQRCRDLGVALRCCADFPGLGTRWIRVSVRNELGNRKLAEVLARVLRPASTSSRPSVARDVHRGTTNAPPQRRAIMLQGCSSDAGKSMLVTALCRCLVQDGYRVAPFKAQNMSNNSGVARDGGEIGRAQVLQAQASGIDPDTRMNPILLKPNSDRGAQVVIRGRSIGHRDALEYHATKRRCLEEALRAFDDLASEYDVIVCEGAGSAGEMNLRSADIVNMGFVTERPMPVLLVGDIDRGGVYASFIGHMEVMSEADRAQVRGFLVNRFRGVKSLLADAHSAVERHTGRPVLGVVPYLADLGLPDEDRLSLTSGARRWGDPAAPLRIAAVAGPHVSNFTDLDALACEDDVWVRLVERPEEIEQPDLIVLLGTKNTLADLAHFRRIGLAQAMLDAQCDGATIVGICGGLQMLGERVEDDEGVESGHRSAMGLSLLPLTTRFALEKTVRRTAGKHVASQLPVSGYEIHHGESELSSLAPWLVDEAGAALGVALPEQRVFGTYLHGLFDADGFRRHFLDDLRERKGLERLGRSRRSSDLEPSIDRLAQVFRESVDLPVIYRMIGLHQ